VDEGADLDLLEARGDGHFDQLGFARLQQRFLVLQAVSRSTSHD
jgi:hypothetical protein